MKPKKNHFIRSLVYLSRELFGFGRAKQDTLKEEEITGPFKQIIKKFIRNKLSIIGLVIFVGIVLFIVIGNAVIDFIPEEKETTQIALGPGRSLLRVPSKLKSVGVKKTSVLGKDTYLIGGGVSFTVAVGNDDVIYVWGTNTNKIKDVPESIQKEAGNINQLAVGSTHAMVLLEDGRLLGWGKNNFEQAQIPIYNESLDASLPYKKTVEAYFVESSRAKYANDVVTTIEDDPIVQIGAGYEYTTVLSQSGVVYTWGNTKANELSESYASFGYLKLRARLLDNVLQIKYAGRSEWKEHKTYQEMMEMYQLEENELDPYEFRIQGEYLQVKRLSSSWANLAPISELAKDIFPIKIERIKAHNELIAYFFSDGSADLVGLQGIIRSSQPEMLLESTEERGYAIVDVAVLKPNAFALTSEGQVFGWGEYNQENKMIDIPEEVKSVQIKEIDGGIHHMVASSMSGEVHTWGYNNRRGQLNKPARVEDSQMVEANYLNSFSIDSKGKVTIWGHKGYLFGTDLVGADIFSRVIAGGGMTLAVAAVAVLVSLIIGLLFGLLSGFYGGWIDNVLMRFGEIISAFPFLPLAMTLAKIVEDREVSEDTRIFMIMIILGFLSWPGLARLVRGQILAEREKDFVLASKALGIREKHIILRHILPNVVNIVIVSTTLSYAGTLLTEAGLSYLNFGVKYPRPSWGNLLNSAQKMVVLETYWWMWIIPAMFLIATALSINLVGDGLREAMDPKSSER